MLSRNSVRAVVAALAILCSAALSKNTLGAFANGDVITYPQDAWGSDPLPGNAAALLLQANYGSVYTSTAGLLDIGIPGSAGFSMTFTNVSDLLGYLPASGASGPLTSDLVDPSSSAAGGFGGNVTALRINIDFSDAGVTLGTLGIPFGDLELHSFTALPALNGLTVRQFQDIVKTLLGGGSSIYSIADLRVLVDDLNVAFGAGFVTPIAQDHLRVPGIPGDYNANGTVDAADYTVWRDRVGTTMAMLNDPIGGTIGSAQYNQWRSHFGQPAGSAGANTNAAVPEPATAGLLLLGMLAMWCGRFGLEPRTCR